MVDQGKVFIRGYCNDIRRIIRIDGPIIVFGDHTRETKLIDFDFVVGADGVKLLKPIEIDPAYYFLALQWVPLDSRGYARHFKLLRASRFPLPPLSEQHRIVAKVNELMALCDELEAALAKRERRRDRLVAATLHGLNNGNDRSEAGVHPTSEESAHFYFNHLPRLTTRPEHIHRLRQTILNLAVRGKLVPQDPKDEPASELLKQIAQEQYTLIKNGRLRNQTILNNSEACDWHYPIPKEWRWVRLSDLITFGPQNGVSRKPTDDKKATKSLTLTATTSGRFNPAHFKYIELHEADCENYWLVSGDVLFQRGNTRDYVGIAAVFDGPERSFLFPDLMIRVRFSESLALRFIHTALISPPLRQYFSTLAAGAASSMPKISQGVLLKAPIPLPPLVEQHRIVAKVDELMALCDELETRITEISTNRRQLLEATLQEALSADQKLHQMATL